MKSMCGRSLLSILWLVAFTGLISCSNSISTLPGTSPSEGTPTAGAPSFNGNEGASGSDETRDKGHGYWFMNPDQEIQYCAKIDYATFGVTDEAVLDKLIRRSFQKWLDYFKKKRAFRFSVRFPFASVLEKKQKLTDCEGDEDVVFYFGLLNARIEATLARPEHENAIALAIPSTTKHVPWRKDNILWFSSPIRLKETAFQWEIRHDTMPYAPLEAELIHEWGHTFGFDHIPGTIMDEKLKETILSVVGYSELLNARVFNSEPALLDVRLDYLTRIDNTREFIVCDECPEEVIPGYFTGSPEISRLNELGLLFTGVSNLYSASDIVPPRANLTVKLSSGAIGLTGEEESPSFVLSGAMQGHQFELPIFASALDYNISFGVYGKKENSNDAIYIGTIRNLYHQATLPVVILRNRDHRMSPLVIRAIDAGNSNLGTTLFVAESLPVAYSNLTVR